MVLEVLADPGQVVHRLDAMPAHQLRRPDTGELKNLRRTDRAGAQQHLGARPGLAHVRADGVAHSDRAPLLEAQAVHVRPGLDTQVWTPAGRGAGIRPRCSTGARCGR